MLHLNMSHSHYNYMETKLQRGTKNALTNRFGQKAVRKALVIIKLRD